MAKPAQAPPPALAALRRWLASRPWRAIRPESPRRRRERALAQALDELRRHGEHSDARIAEMTEQIGNLRWWLEQTSDRGAETAGRLEAALADRARDQERVERLLEGIVADNVGLDHPGGLELDTFDAGLGGLVRGFRDGLPTESSGVYLGFEDWFRGAESEIAERMRAYVPLMRGCESVLDLGCGRGEFLEVMRQAGIGARGIDIDSAMVDRARQHGLDVQESDAVTYLTALDDHVLGAIFAAQLIEHLAYDDLLQLFRVARDKLVPGGILVMETINPHAPQALKHFWIDPTHRHPLFPEVVLGLCRLIGFAEGYVWYPQGTGDPDRDRRSQMDYAIVARTGDRSQA
jgi:SAM-dependent methyltransferase